METKKRFTIGVAAVAAAAASVFVTSFAGPANARPATTQGNPTIADVVAQSGSGFDQRAGDFDVLLAALTAADLVETLDTPDLDVTVWAPKDRAFVRTARDLGFTGLATDEEGAWNFLVAALTELGGGDPIPVLTTILQYHVTPDARGVRRVLPAERFPTLARIPSATSPAAPCSAIGIPTSSTPAGGTAEHLDLQRRHPQHQEGAPAGRPVATGLPPAGRGTVLADRAPPRAVRAGSVTASAAGLEREGSTVLVMADAPQRVAPDRTGGSPLAHRFAAGDPGAIEEVYAEHRALVHSFCRRSLDAGRAADATQDVFLAAWRSRDRYRPDAGTLAGWLLGIARFKVIDVLRAEGRHADWTPPAPRPG